MYVLAQVIGFAATAILLTYTLMYVSRKTIMICNIIINLLWAVHYFLLEAYTGCFCSIFTSIMVVCCAFKGTNPFFKGPWVPILFNVLFLLIEGATFAGLPTVIQIIGNFILVMAMWSDEEVQIKALFIPVGVLWLVYNLMYVSWIGIICQTLAVTFNILFMMRYFRRKKQINQA